MQKCKIAVLISGGGSNLQVIIDNIQKGDIDGEIVLVIANKENAYGLERAKIYGIDNMFIGKSNYPDLTLRSEKLVEVLIEKKVDLVVMAGYLEILDSCFIKKFRDKIINIHPSLIPKYSGKGFYGMKVHEAVKANGEKFSGATVHFVDEGVDTGQLIIQEAVRLLEDDSVQVIQKKVLEIEHKILTKGIQKFIGGEI